MRNLLAALLAIHFFTITIAAQAPDPITLQRGSATLHADFYPAERPAPVILLLHMLNSDGGAWRPLIPDLLADDYAILNIDMRGHGDSSGARDWEAAIDDVVDGWARWLAENQHLGESGLAIIGASIGANVGLISCARMETCRGAVALSPGLDYRGVKPETALADGLANRSALLVASQADRSSSAAIRQMFQHAKGDVTGRMYRGRAHGTRLFDSDYESVSSLILGWLAEHLPVPKAADQPVVNDDGTETLCGISGLERSKRNPEYFLCGSVPSSEKPVRRGDCLYEHLDDRDGDGQVCGTDRDQQ